MPCSQRVAAGTGWAPDRLGEEQAASKHSALLPRDRSLSAELHSASPRLIDFARIRQMNETADLADNLTTTMAPRASGTGARRIRVAFCIDNMQIGGTELNAVRTAERLDRSRFEVSVICFRDHGPLLARYAAAGIPVHIIPITSLYGRDSLRQGIRLARLIRDRRIDVFHAHDTYSNVFGVPWARLGGARTIASRRWREGPPGLAWTLCSRAAYRIAHAALGNSSAMGALLASEGLSSRRIAIVPNFVDASAFDAPEAEERRALVAAFGVREDAPTIGVVANLHPVKDHASLLRATARLIAQWPGLQVIFVGDGECRSSLERLASELGIRDRIVFAGRRSNQPNLHHLFDISVLCSTSEGLPNSILEAMAAGKPVVATSVGAIPDAVVHGKTGLLIPPSAPDALAAALDELLGDPARARAMGLAGQRRARDVFSPEAALSSLGALYESLVASRTARATGWQSSRRSSLVGG